MKEKLSICFSGWLSIPFDNLTITDSTGEEVNYDQFSHEQLLDKLNKKELFIDFVATVEDCRDYTVEMFEFSTEQTISYLDQDGNKVICYNE